MHILLTDVAGCLLIGKDTEYTKCRNIFGCPPLGPRKSQESTNLHPYIHSKLRLPIIYSADTTLPHKHTKNYFRVRILPTAQIMKRNKWIPVYKKGWISLSLRTESQCVTSEAWWWGENNRLFGRLIHRELRVLDHGVIYLPPHGNHSCT